MKKNESKAELVLMPKAARDAMIPVPLESLPRETSLPFPVYLRVSGQLVLFRRTGERLTGDRIHNLQDQNVGVGFVPEMGWLQYMKSVEYTATNRIGEASDFHTDPNTESSVTRLRHLLVAYNQQIEMNRAMQRAHLERLRDLAHRLAFGIASEPQLAGKLLRKYSDPNLYFVNHSVNVAIYCAAVAQKLRMTLDDTKMLTFSALVHNIGNLFIPQEVLYKPTTLTREEWQMVVTHPPEGAKLLEALAAPREVVLTAMQHHERVDGMGYPENRPGIDIHIFAKITSIADVFDALTNSSPYRLAMTPQEAVEKILSMNGKFDPTILNMLSSVK